MIQISHVSKTFKQVKAVQDLTLHIGKGEFVALLGPNGAGKTTLVEMIEGLQFPDSGHISIGQMNWQQHEHQLRRLIGVSLQETYFEDKLSVEEILHLFASFYGLGQSRVEEILSIVKLEAKRKAYSGKLSGGQRQRLALGVALLNQPQILILDEPTTGLDPNARRELWDILLQMRAQSGLTLLLTTHYMEEAEHLCERIVIMDSGKILADGTLSGLLKTYDKGELIQLALSAEPPLHFGEAIPGLMELHRQAESAQPYAARLLVQDITQALPPLLAFLQTEGIELLELGSRRKTLDDLFVAMTGRQLSDG
jgi:ABC-2 type transport system ATP-binding protein